MKYSYSQNHTTSIRRYMYCTWYSTGSLNILLLSTTALSNRGSEVLEDWGTGVLEHLYWVSELLSYWEILQYGETELLVNVLSYLGAEHWSGALDYWNTASRSCTDHRHRTAVRIVAVLPVVYLGKSHVTTTVPTHHEVLLIIASQLTHLFSCFTLIVITWQSWERKPTLYIPTSTPIADSNVE